ncbi:cupredoxin domain-containing protein [Myxococcus landrumensis]|uniref:Cupredoxin domain-containing protein n=1 Tax=Myxococcus landrumensis TaxID=2813577 RepID=A0ABX7NBZ6_9BACT|nr:cupredoxin domain-containing protein [Myxococcus landrumus]QSQ14926.1 cupredoxin domain-containing protein [Myxococcus landrumus]
MMKRLMGVLVALPLIAAAPALASSEHDAHAKKGGHVAHQGSGKTAGASEQKPAAAPVTKNGVQLVDLTVTSKGFEPANVKVKAGKPVRLLVTRKTDKTCATELVMTDLGIHQPLPLDTPVTVEFTPSESGTLRYACAMDHISGLVTIQ